MGLYILFSVCVLVVAALWKLASQETESHHPQNPDRPAFKPAAKRPTNSLISINKPYAVESDKFHNGCSLTIVEIYDPNDYSSYVDANLPSIITAKYTGSFEEATSKLLNCRRFLVSNIRKSRRVKSNGYIEFSILDGDHELDMHSHFSKP